MICQNDVKDLLTIQLKAKKGALKKHPLKYN